MNNKKTSSSSESSKNSDESSLIVAKIEKLIKENDIAAAAKICKDFLVANPKDSRGYNLVGKMLLAKNNPIQALANFNLAIEYSPENAEYQTNAGNCCLLLNMQNDAHSYLEKSLNLEPHNTNTLYSIARFYINYQALDKAIEPLEMILKIDEKFIRAYELLSDTYERLNNIDSMTQTLAKAELLFPSEPSLFLSNARLKIRKKEYAAAEAMLRNIINNPNSHNKWRLGSAYFELGKILDRSGKYDEAFACYSSSQSLLREANQAMFERLNVEFDSLINSCKRWFIKKNVKDWPTQAYSDVNYPVFLIGFPRSGTTLAEQILSAHNKILTTQEAPIMDLCLKQLPLIFNKVVTYPDILAKLNSNDIEKLQKFYLSEMAKLFPQQNISKKLIVDKMPFNMLCIGMIYKLFPAAKIIMMIRDPRDAVLSCFMQTFNHTTAMSKMYSLESTSAVYKQSFELYNQYIDVFNPVILEVKYEDLLDNTEKISREMTDFIGIEWDESVLRYYDKDKQRATTTPSYEAVTKPIYKSSSGRWKNYQQHFNSQTLSNLEPFIKQFGY